jgi:sulfatase modifying factor 1
VLRRCACVILVGLWACVPRAEPGRGAARADVGATADGADGDAAARASDVEVDASVREDAVVLDAGEGVDAEGVDAGEGVDADGVDAGEGVDAAARADAGEVVDASAADAAVIPDGGAPAVCTAEGVAGECVDVSTCASPRRAVPGHCPGPREIQCCITPVAPSTCDPAVVPVPAHAGLTEAPGRDGCPPGMLLVAGTCVDVYEAVLFEVSAGGALTAWSPFHNPGARRVRAASIGGVTPQAYVSGRQAAAACAEAGKRLCTDAEWLRACRGPGATTYPYGPARQPGVCNDARAQHPAVEYFGTSAAWIWSELGNACIDQLPDSLALTGDHPGCVSVEGAFDLMGNLHEWTADPAGTFRGGYYVDTVINGAGCLYATTAHDVGHWDYSTGFRCCADGP